MVHTKENRREEWKDMRWEMFNAGSKSEKSYTIINNTHTSELTIHSAPTKISLMTSKPPFQIDATRGSQRVEVRCLSLVCGGGAVASIAKSRSLCEISSPAMRVGWRFGIGSCSELKLGVAVSVASDGGNISGGGGPSHGAGWQSAIRSCPSPQPISTTWAS